MPARFAGAPLLVAADLAPGVYCGNEVGGTGPGGSVRPANPRTCGTAAAPRQRHGNPAASRCPPFAEAPTTSSVDAGPPDADELELGRRASRRLARRDSAGVSATVREAGPRVAALLRSERPSFPPIARQGRTFAACSATAIRIAPSMPPFAEARAAVPRERHGNPASTRTGYGRRTQTVWKCGSEAPCRRAPEPLSSRR